MLSVFRRKMADMVRLCRAIVCMLGPKVPAIGYEKLAARNVFSLLSGVTKVTEIRERHGGRAGIGHDGGCQRHQRIHPERNV